MVASAVPISDPHAKRHMTTLVEWAKSQTVDADLAVAAEHGYNVEARALQLLIDRAEETVGTRPTVFVKGMPEAEQLTWEERTSPHGDAVRLWLALREAPSFAQPPSDVEVVVSRVQRVTMPNPEAKGRWTKRTGVVVLVKGPSERERIAVFLTEG